MTINEKQNSDNNKTSNNLLWLLLALVDRPYHPGQSCRLSRLPLHHSATVSCLAGCTYAQQWKNYHPLWWLSRVHEKKKCIWKESCRFLCGWRVKLEYHFTPFPASILKFRRWISLNLMRNWERVIFGKNSKLKIQHSGQFHIKYYFFC